MTGTGSSHGYRVARNMAAVVLLAVAAAGNATSAENNDLFRGYLAQMLTQPKIEFSGVIIEPLPMESVYRSIGYQPLWVNGSGLSARASKALAVIAESEADGLKESLYSVESIRTVAALPRGDAEHEMRRRLSLELLTSQAIMRYAGDMYGGAVRRQWETGHAVPDEEAQALLLANAAAKVDTAGFLQSLAPTSTQYVALKGILAKYRAIAANGGWPKFTVGKPIKPDTTDTRVATLRQILVITGDLESDAAPNEKRNLYSDDTIEAVKKFQERHGLEPDGIIGTSTQQALATPVLTRIDQMAATLERMRWMPRDLGNRYVVVNVPAYRLSAVSGSKTMGMDVIVGKPATKTPMFSKSITNVVLNPSWGVPPRIAKQEMLPKIRSNPEYLTNAGYTLTENGETVDPSTVDWEAVDAENFNYALKQAPGDANALGKVKFTIPNSDSIYLHDTAQRGLFARNDRSLSHGCIRLAQPKELTEFILSAEGWSAKDIEAAYTSSTPRTVAIAPMPVHLVYWTSWVDHEGRPRFQRDIYGMDKSLVSAMGGPSTAPAMAMKLAMQ